MDKPRDWMIVSIACILFKYAVVPHEQPAASSLLPKGPLRAIRRIQGALFYRLVQPEAIY